MTPTLAERTESEQAAAFRQGAMLDIYTGLRRIGYTAIGAMRTMRRAGIGLGEAKAAHDRYMELFPPPS